jgi:prepilin-type processing-associated H-X9-DG protein
LSHLGFEPLYNSINFNAQPSNPVNRTAKETRVEVFLCPSDPSTQLQGPKNNLRLNGGTGPYWQPLRTVTGLPTVTSGDGVFDVFGPKAPRDVTDGLSHTAMMSERVVGSGANRFVPERDVSLLRNFTQVSADRYFEICSVQFGTPFVASGSHWIQGGPESTWYNHVASPNNPVPDCGEGAEMPHPGMFTARSWHPKGVNVLMADGSCRFIGDAIEVSAWRAIGSRAGNEQVDKF